MADIPDAAFDAAIARGQQRLASEPRAAAARFDRQLDRVVVDLTNGCSFLFPARIVQGLEAATPDQLVKVEVLGLGFGLHWEDLDVDISVPGLLSGVFGTKAFIDRSAGQVTPSKTAAASHPVKIKRQRPRKVSQS